MTSLIESAFSESITIRQNILNDSHFLDALNKAFEIVREVVAKGGCVYSCGNGGSCCDAMHLTEELVARYKKERQGFKAVCFSDAGGITCWSNDYDYTSAFARYAETFCTSQDVLIGFSTSGNSQNVIEAVEKAHRKGCKTIALLGKDGGKLLSKADVSLVVPAKETARIQEVHITIVHILCELLEKDI